MKVIQRISTWSIVLLLVLAGLGVTTWQGWNWWLWANAAPAAEPSPNSNAKNTKKVKLQIREGTSAQEIGKDLEALGLIRSTTAWDMWTRWRLLKEPQGGFKAGTYELSKSESMQAIADKIWAGDVMQQSFTIPEGWNLRQMAAYFEQQGFFSAQEFLTATQQLPLANYPWLPTASAGTPRLEGFLYPDTYQAGTSITPDLVITQMLDRFEQVALPLYQQAQGKTSLTFAQWVTLASIVEKEAVIASERPLIAGVFTNRLRKGIPLGADPTVEYALGIQQTPDRPLTLNDVKTPSPYNTYLNPGLPPTPIASPGLASLKATLSPEATDYLYFVARYDGTHVFSRTLADHQTAQDKIHDKRESAQPSTQSSPATKN